MKRAFFVLLLLLSMGASAGVSFDLERIRLVDFAKLVYSEVLKKPYVLDSSFLALEDVVTVNVSDLAPKVIEGRLVDMLSDKGFSVSLQGGVTVISKAKEPEEGEGQSIVVYRPKFRTVSYLLDLAASLFPRNSFSTQRAMSGSQDSYGYQGQQPSTSRSRSSSGVSGQGQGQAQQAATVRDSGSSVYSMFDKAEVDAMVFRGSAKHADQLRSLLAQLDVPSGELLVKAVVYEVRKDVGDTSAVDVVASVLSGKLGISITSKTSADNVLKFSSGSFSALWSALATDSRFKLVSSPTVRVKSGGQARFVAGADVPVLGATTYTQSGAPVQSVEYKSSGVILDLRPQVRDSETDLSISQQISSFVPTSTGVNSSPTLLKRELSTRVSVSDDEMLVLGGLDEDRNTEESSGLSFLPSWLRGSSSSSQRTEVLVLLNVKRL